MCGRRQLAWKQQQQKRKQQQQQRRDVRSLHLMLRLCVCVPYQRLVINDTALHSTAHTQSMDRLRDKLTLYASRLCLCLRSQANYTRKKGAHCTCTCCCAVWQRIMPFAASLSELPTGTQYKRCCCCCCSRRLIIIHERLSTIGDCARPKGFGGGGGYGDG